MQKGGPGCLCSLSNAIMLLLARGTLLPMLCAQAPGNKAAVAAAPCRDTILFEAPRVRVEATGVVLTTYFNSRVDPLRCYKHKVRDLAGLLQGGPAAGFVGH